MLDNEAFDQGCEDLNAANAVLNVFGSSIDTNFAGSRGAAVNNLGRSTYLNTTITQGTLPFHAAVEFSMKDQQHPVSLT